LLSGEKKSFEIRFCNPASQTDGSSDQSLVYMLDANNQRSVRLTSVSEEQNKNIPAETIRVAKDGTQDYEAMGIKY